MRPGWTRRGRPGTAAGADRGSRSEELLEALDRSGGRGCGQHDSRERCGCVEDARAGIRENCVIRNLRRDHARQFCARVTRRETGATFFFRQCSSNRHMPRNLSYLWTTSRERKLKRRRKGCDENPDGFRNRTGTTTGGWQGCLRYGGEIATIVISGARIAKEVGVSRVHGMPGGGRLRELGVKVKSQPGTGYFLERGPPIF